MSFSFTDFAAALKAGAHLSAGDVLAVRREVWPDGRISDDEARALFEVDRLAADPAPEWADFFLEALCDHVVNGKEPKGYIDLPNAAWLVEEIERGGEPPSRLELELAVKVIERALNGPAELKSWVLARIEEEVRRDGRVDAREAGLLRRTIFASGGDGALAVSQDEAELLWRLKHACREADNAPEWKILFVQGVGNHLMAYNSYTPLERGEAARLEAFMDDRRSSVLGFFARMRGANPVDEARGLLGGGDAPRVDHDAAVDEARAITGNENAWLQTHVDADGVRDAYEEALLAFVAEESGG
ncbi:MAG: hypothetical protein QOD42_2939 [Sphingomonadales bacterium]|jgi:hypothetical protein|nr:hypothetical protein [Sphingomonadales bacterium]